MVMATVLFWSVERAFCIMLAMFMRSSIKLRAFFGMLFLSVLRFWPIVSFEVMGISRRVQMIVASFLSAYFLTSIWSLAETAAMRSSLSALSSSVSAEMRCGIPRSMVRFWTPTFWSAVRAATASSAS